VKVGRAERRVAEIPNKRIEKKAIRPDFARKHLTRMVALESPD